MSNEVDTRGGSTAGGSAASSVARRAPDEFLAVVEQVPFLFWMSGPDTLCTYFNRAWLEYRGRSVEEELGHGWMDGLHGEDVSRFMNAFLTAFHARQPFRIEHRLRRKDGLYGWVLNSGAPRYVDGDFAGYTGCAVELGNHPRNASGATASEADLSVRLTPREQQVLTLVAEGHSTKEIGQLLGISFKTADSHRSRIMDKLNLHDTASLVRYAVRRGLIQA